jgi:SET domain-containing protein
MLKVKTYLDNSTINGIGLFANQFIEKGTLIWKFTIFVDRTFSKHVVENMPESDMKEFIMKYSYLDNDSFPHYVLCVDDARFMNHAKKPNTSNGEGKTTIANRDIMEGEELTCNYYEIDDDAKRKLSPKIITECIHDGSISRPLVKIKGKWLCGYCNEK